MRQDVLEIAEMRLTHVITTPWNILFGTAELTCDKMTNTFMLSIRKAVQAYKARAFQVTNILGDGGFKCARKHLKDMGKMLNVTFRDEHVPEVERYIRTN